MIQIVVTDWLELDLVIKISDGYCPDCGQTRAGPAESVPTISRGDTEGEIPE
jgi:hypothetical protein